MSPGWALDPWSEEPRFVAVDGSRDRHYFPKPVAFTIADYSRDIPPLSPLEVAYAERRAYRSPFLGRIEVFGPADKALPLLRRAEGAIMFCAWIKKITEAP